MRALQAFAPAFVDVTWGAGGATCEDSLALARCAAQEWAFAVNLHLTCTNMDATLVDHALEACKEMDVTRILALRGDAPVGQTHWRAADSSLTCAADLVRYIRGKYGDFFTLSVAGYPEGHPEAMEELSLEEIATLTPLELLRCSRDMKTVPKRGGAQGETETVPVIHVCRDAAFVREIEYLKVKIDAGAQSVITQMFFDVEVYRSFVQACREHGITCEIVPGIMCVSNYAGFQRMVKLCRTRVPEAVLQRMEAIKDDAEAVKRYGIEILTEMCERLIEMGVPGLHFYTLNSAQCVVAVLENLSYKATS